jgi:hypothetical protein
MEYFVVLFGIRYDSHWRRSQQLRNKFDNIATAAQVQLNQNQQPHPIAPSPARIHISNQNLQMPSSISNLPNVETPVRTFESLKCIEKK